MNLGLNIIILKKRRIFKQRNLEDKKFPELQLIILLGDIRKQDKQEKKEKVGMVDQKQQ